jgi:hypothetical protein
MIETDPLSSLLREWKAPEPAPGLDQRIVDAYRTARPDAERRTPAWWGFWKARVSVPVPVLVAAMVVFALLIWFRPKPVSPPPDSANVVTRLSAAGYQPLPNGEARIVQIKETNR